uniref:SFRICE_018008 n=1 Tax=Spodoptera frugiperda TaxID=7108 RepID=A0A2H1VRQ1_SPOFR
MCWDLMRRYNTDGMASPGFGLQANPIRDRPSSLLFKEGLTFTFWRRIYYFITIQFPAGAKIILGSHELFPVCAGRIELLSSEGTKFFRKIVSDTIAYRKKNNLVKTDFVLLLMEASQASYESSLSTFILRIHELSV